MEKQRLTSASRSKLPIASIIPNTEIMQQAIKTLQDALKIKAKISELKEEEDAKKEELEAICAAMNLADGFRHGKIGFSYRSQTRSTISKEKLLENGVSAEQIDQSYSTSAPFTIREIIAFDLE